jgi:hypothetical protein
MPTLLLIHGGLWEAFLAAVAGFAGSAGPAG